MIPGVSDNHEIAVAWIFVGIAFFFWAVTRLIAFWMRPNWEDAARLATMLSMAAVAFDTVYIRWRHTGINSERTIRIRWIAAICVTWALLESIRQVRRDLRDQTPSPPPPRVFTDRDVPLIK